MKEPHLMYRIFLCPCTDKWYRAIPYVPTKINDGELSFWIHKHRPWDFSVIGFFFFFCSSFVLLVYFSYRFIQAVSRTFQNRFSTWLGLCSVSAPTHKTLLLSPEAQLTWQGFGCSLVQIGETDEGDDMSILFGYFWSKSSWSLWMLWPALYLTIPFTSSLKKPSELLFT